jgi:DNA-binding NtrC family response regulator
VRAILAESGTPDDAAALNGDLFAVPIRRGQAELGVLVFVPPSAELASDSIVRTAATLCAMVLDGGHRADRAVTRAGAPAGAVADGAGRAFEATLVPPFVTVSPACREMLVEVDRLALTDLPILIHGETGTGKELLAERIHAVSPRRHARFIGINCAALPGELLEAELFGIERGVATGVDPRPGQFQLASGGTLLLDEIGDMPADLQPKLLRALESGRVHPVGSADPVTTDVRIVASSHQPLEEKVERGEFRRDLYHRICGALVDVPPLRERPDDVLPLARVFLREACAKQKRRCEGVDLDAARALAGYRWPGNVRELRAVVFRAVALSRGSVIQAEDLPRTLRGESDAVRADAVLALDEDLRTARAKFERMYFARLIERCDGNLSKAAAEAGLARWSLYKKLEALGLRGAGASEDG